MPQKKYVALSVPNLKKIMNWCEAAGAGTKMADAYLNACGLVYTTAMDPPDSSWHLIGRSAYEIRDTIGRIILKELKRQGAE